MTSRFRGYRLGREGRYFPERLERRRFRVAARPKVLRLKRAERLAAALVASLAVAAAVVIRRFPMDRLKAPAFPVSFLPDVLRLDDAAIAGAPPALEKRLMQDLGPNPVRSWGWREPYSAAARLRRDFPCLSSVSFERDWRGRRVRFSVELERPVASVTRGGLPWGWLSGAGRLFTAPAGVYPEADRPAAELGRGGDSEAAPLASFLQDALKEGALPARLERVEYRSPEEGWELTLSDRSKVSWGSLNWTDQKLSRLKEVLADARARGRAGWSADLRYFEDGKILMRPKI